MRILTLHSQYLSGPVSGENRVVEDEVRLLREAGHTVHTWTPSHEGSGPRALLRTGVRAVWARNAAATVRGLIREHEADIVHCHSLFPALSPAVLRAAAKEGAHSIVTLHSYRLVCLPATLVRDGRICEDCIGRFPWPGVLHGCYHESSLASIPYAASLGLHRVMGTFDGVDLYLAVSRFLRDKYIESGFEADKIEVKGNFAWEAPRRTGPGDYFLYLGRLSSEKGVDTLLTAWKRCSGKLLIVGDGPDAGRLRSLASRNVEFLGSVPAAEVPALLSRARALLLPSICYEGEPRTVLEAYAVGVPVVASRIGGLPDLVRDGVSGVLLTPGDVAAWTATCEGLLDDKESERLGEGAFRLWMEQYSPEHGLQALERAYARAMTRGPDPA